MRWHDLSLTGDPALTYLASILLICLSFVELQPRAKKFYKSEEMMQKHTDGIVHLLDSILQMLGPDVEFIEEILGQIGSRHAKMGVSPSFFPFLGQAFIWAMEKTLGEMTDEQKESWEEVYDAISEQIVKAILNASK